MKTKSLNKKILFFIFQKVIKKYISYNMLDSSKDVWKNIAKLGFSPHSIIDIGAAKGNWTKELVKIFPNTKFLMVEPLKENLKSLEDVCSEKENIKYWTGIVCGYNGESNFNVHSDQSSIFNSEFKGSITKVQAKTLDSLLTEMNILNVDAIKLDVQGAELEVLKGAEKSIKSCKVIQMEVSFRKIYENAPLVHELIRYMTDKGFRIFDIADTFKRKKDRALLQADIFFVSDETFFNPESWYINNEKKVF